MVLMKGVVEAPKPKPAVQVPAKVVGLLPAKLDHSVIEGTVWPPVEEEQGLYECGPDWLEKAFDAGYDLAQEAEDVIDCLLNNYGKHIPKQMRKRLLKVHGSLEEYIKFYEGENV